MRNSKYTNYHLSPSLHSIFNIRYSPIGVLRTIFIFFFSLCFASSLPAQEWTEPVNISNMPDHLNQKADLAIDNNGVLHVVWTMKMNSWWWKIMYSKSLDFGETWTEPLDLLQNTDLWMSQPHIACDSKNRLYVTYTYATGTPDKLIYMIIFDGHAWGEPIVVSEGMPGSHYPKILFDNNDGLYVLWGYLSDEMYYRYRKNNQWSDLFCPYCDLTDLFYFSDGIQIANSTMHLSGSSVSYNYYGERPQYYRYDIKNNAWQKPEMISNDTIVVDIDLAINNDGNPESAYRKRSKISVDVTTDSTMHTKKEGGIWDNPQLVSFVSGTQQNQQIAVDQNNNVHIIETEEINTGYRMVHYQKIKDKWSGYTIDSTPNFCNPTKLLFYCNNLYLVYFKDSIPGTPDDNIYFTKYDVVTGITKQTLSLPDLSIYPNPGSDNIYIEFENKARQPINLSIFDMTGKMITTLTNKLIPSGKQKFIWNGKDQNGNKVKNGSYIVRLKTGQKSIAQKVEIVR